MKSGYKVNARTGTSILLIVLIILLLSLTIDIQLSVVTAISGEHNNEVCINPDGSDCTAENQDDNTATSSTTTTPMSHVRSAVNILQNKLPFLLYGTAWKKEKTAEYVEQAIKSGFRFIDTACQPKHYNEPQVGIGWTKAVTDLGLQREDIFIQTKYTSIDGQDPNRIPYDPNVSLEEQVKQSLSISLKNLQTTYLDSLVMHGLEETIDDTMRVYHTMETFVDDGKVHRLGISNCYDYNVFVSIYEQARIKPSVLQNRFYSDTNFDKELRQFCYDNNIWYQSFWTLTASWDALHSNEVQQMANDKSMTSHMLMFAYLLQLGYVTPLSGTTSVQHMYDDVSIMERIQSGEKIFHSTNEIRQFESLIGIP
jgi:diketogulonate reductase-like aldo/keto reductase